jgi:hypothetical protein
MDWRVGRHRVSPDWDVVADSLLEVAEALG